MAKNTQEAEVIVTMNGQAAKKAVAELAQEFERLQKEALEAYKAGDDALGKKLDAQAQKLSRDIEITRRETKKFADVMKNINGASLKELRSAAKQLQSEINKLTPGTKQFIEKSKQLKDVNTRIRELTNSFKGMVEEEKRATFSLKGLADGFNKYFGMVTAGIAAITGVSMAFRKAAQDAAALDDIYADVMKTTGLLHEQVAELDKELMRIDTRTSREQLLLLARDAGKLGITGKENILGFVRAADQIQVALGEDLGEGAIKQLGKIADVYGLTQSMGIEKSLLSIASAVNALGQASTASEGYLVEFTQRLAGVGAMAGISVQDLMGFASGLDQSSMKVEMAATAFQKFLMKMYEDTATFAGYAGMEVEKFSELLKKDANEAITTVLKSLHQSGGFDELVPMFKDMGLDGARAVQVLAAMAKNLGAVTEAQALANMEFEKATSVTDEYRTKNNNLQAQLEKDRKEFYNASVALGQSLNPIMLKSTKIVTYLIKLLATHGKEIRNAAIAVAALTVAVKLDNIVQAASNGLRKVGNALTQTGTYLSNKLMAAYYRLTNQTLKYAAAQRAANAAASKSVFGILAIVIGTVTYKLTELINKEKEFVEVAEKKQTLEQRITEAYAEQKGELEALTNIVNNNNFSLNKRKEALLKLKEIVPNYHADLTEEGVLINNNTTALDAYIVKLKESIRLRTYEEEYAANEKKLMTAQKGLEAARNRKEEMIQANGGVEPATTRATKNSSLTTGTLVGHGILSTFLDAWLGLYDTELTDYGKVLQEIENYTVDVDLLTASQERLADRIGLTIDAENREMQNEIALVQKQYELDLANARKIEDQEEMKDEIKRLNEERDLAIANIHKKYEQVIETENQGNTILTQAQFDYLQERQDKLTKKEREMVAAGYSALTEEQSRALKARYIKLVNIDNKLGDQRYQEQVRQLQREQKAKEIELMDQYLHGDMTLKQYEERRRQIQKSFLKERLILAKQEGKDTTEIEAQLLQLRSDKLKEEYNDQLNELNKCYADEQRALKMSLGAQEITQDEYDSLLLESKVRYLQEKLELVKEYGQDEIDVEKAIEEAIIESQDLAFEQLNKLKKQAQDVTDSVNPKQANARQENLELKELQRLYDLKLISEETFQKKKQEIIRKYGKANLDEDLKNIQEYAQTASQIMEGASNFVNSLKEYETQKAEAEYQAQLTAAGDNAEKREQVEAAYEQKKLDIQKKYADTEMVINIAKTVAAGALAAIQAFAQLGPIGGAIAAALIAVTTAMEVATIVQQRNAIKNSSVNSSSSSSSSVKTGTRTITGYAEGGYTEDHTTLTTVGERGREWVGPAWMVKKNPVMFANLERYRKAGSHGRSGSVSSGFADGGFAGGDGSSAGSGSANLAIDIEAAVETAIRRSMADGAIRAYLVRKDLTELDNQTERFKNQTSR